MDSLEDLRYRLSLFLECLSVVVSRVSHYLPALLLETAVEGNTSDRKKVQ